MVKPIVDIDAKSSIDSTKILSKAGMKLIGKRILVGVVVTVAVTVISSVALAAFDAKINPVDLDTES